MKSYRQFTTNSSYTIIEHLIKMQDLEYKQRLEEREWKCQRFEQNMKNVQ